MDGKESLQGKGRQIQLKEACREVNDHNEADPEKNEPGSASFEPDQQDRDHHGNDDDVKAVLNPHTAEYRKQFLAHEFI